MGILDRSLLEDNFRAVTATFIEQMKTAEDALEGEEDESVIPEETPGDILGGDMLDESCWADAGSLMKWKERDSDTYRGEAAVVKTGYGTRQETVSCA